MGRESTAKSSDATNQEALSDVTPRIGLARSSRRISPWLRAMQSTGDRSTIHLDQGVPVPARASEPGVPHSSTVPDRQDSVR